MQEAGARALVINDDAYLYDGPRSGARYSLVATDVSEQAGDRPSLRGSPLPGEGKSTTNQPRLLAPVHTDPNRSLILMRNQRRRRQPHEYSIGGGEIRT